MAYNVYFSCDKCGLAYNWVNHMVAYSTAVKIARRKGWQVGARGWYCSVCKNEVNRRAKKGEKES